MNVLHQIIVMLLTLGLLVTIHEYGHYWVARKSGVKVLRFSIGFGPIIYSRVNRAGTEFAISILPLGGYVKMLDEREAPVSDEEKPLAFNIQPVKKRIAIVSAGPLANFLLAFLVYWFLFMQGTTGLLPLVYQIEEGSLADMHGMFPGVQITRVDQIETPTVNAVAMQLMNRIGDEGEIVISARKPGTDLDTEYRLPISQWLGHEEGDIDLFTSLGVRFYEPFIEPVIDGVMDGSAGEKAGIVIGDRLVSADGKAITDWKDWVKYVRARPEQVIAISVLRDGSLLNKEIIPGKSPDNDAIGFVGLQVKVPDVPAALLVKQDHGAFSAAWAAVQRTGQTSLFTLRSMARIITGDISHKQLSGPISIARVASESANSGIYSYLSLLALLSVSLAVLNLLPVPVLDGGHILFYLVEWLTGSPIPEKLQQVAFQLGMFIVLSVMALAMVNDIARL